MVDNCMLQMSVALGQTGRNLERKHRLLTDPTFSTLLQSGILSKGDYNQSILDGASRKDFNDQSCEVTDLHLRRMHNLMATMAERPVKTNTKCAQVGSAIDFQWQTENGISSTRSVQIGNSVVAPQLPVASWLTADSMKTAVLQPPAPPTAKNESSRTFSVGSVGHPERCAEACKYIKRKTGCMMGADCPKCHFCHWQRKSTNAASPPEEPKETKDVQNAGPLDNAGVNCVAAFSGLNDVSADQPGLQTYSVGSMNHPVGCAAACRFVKRKGGCRLGASCPECHLCQWRRSPPKTPVEAMGLETKSTPGFHPDATAELQRLIRLQLDRASRPPLEVPGSIDVSVDIGHRSAVKGSVGSIGHPDSCAKSCKYQRKWACKAGELCRRCHLCHWSRKQHNDQPVSDLGGSALYPRALGPPPGLEEPTSFLPTDAFLLPRRRPVGLVSIQ